MYTRKTPLAALGFALMLITTPSNGQSIGSPYFGPPHNVIYWNGDQTNGEWDHLLNSFYTDVIINFVQPDSGCNLNVNPSQYQSTVDTLHSYGKSVLIAFGGESDYPPGSTLNTPNPGIPSMNYQACDGNIQYLASQLSEIVQQSHFDGVDIDFEDTSAFDDGQNPVLYNGVEFLISLTTVLNTNLPFAIITHAPLTAYWQDPSPYNNAYCGRTYAPYACVFWSVGSYISWFNNQFYNDTGTGENGGSSVTEKETFYNAIAVIYGVPTLKLLVGLPIDSGTAGHIEDGDLQNLIATLQQNYTNQFGGIMAWNFANDFTLQQNVGYNWSFNVINYLSNNQHPMFAQNEQNWNCMDSTGGAAYTDTCAQGARTTQYWKWFGNLIINAGTGLCLDVAPDYSVITDSCFGQHGVLTQNWQVLGTGNTNGGVAIRNRQTLQCLDSGQGSLTFVCNGGPYQDWSVGNQ